VGRQKNGRSGKESAPTAAAATIAKIHCNRPKLHQYFLGRLRKWHLSIRRIRLHLHRAAIARLGATLHVKGEITGNEDLHIDGTVEGWSKLEDRKLTIRRERESDLQI